MWANCRAYNEPGSEIVKDADNCRRQFSTLCKQCGLPTKPTGAGGPAAAGKLGAVGGSGGAGAGAAGGAAANVRVSGGTSTRPLAVHGAGAAAGSGMQAGSGAGAAAAAGAGAAGGVGVDEHAWVRRAQEVVRAVMTNDQCGWPFAEPVDPKEVPDYLEVGWWLGRLVGWLGRFVGCVGRLLGVRRPGGWAVGCGWRSGMARPGPSTCRCLGALSPVVLPAPTTAPQVISHPMDLGTISEKLKKRRYKSQAQVGGWGGAPFSFAQDAIHERFVMLFRRMRGGERAGLGGKRGAEDTWAYHGTFVLTLLHGSCACSSCKMWSRCGPTASSTTPQVGVRPEEGPASSQAGCCS